MEEIDGTIKEFLVESYESLDQLDRDFLVLEDEPANQDRLSSVFRTIHTIQGTSGFLGFSKLEKVTHVGENLLVPPRDGELRLNNEIASEPSAMVDVVGDILGQIETQGEEGSVQYSELIARLQALRKGGSPPKQ